MEKTYDILELSKMPRLQLVELAKQFKIHVLTDEAAGIIWTKQTIIYEILDRQQNGYL